jgi:hypothetical protein
VWVTDCYGQAKIDMKALFIFIFILSTNQLYACDCGKLADLRTQQKRAISQSNLILIGDVISIDKDNERYLIKVIEILKVQVATDTLEGIRKTNCSMIPTVGRWLFYKDPVFFEDDLIINKKFDYSVCGMSRSFRNPEKVFIEEYVSVLEKPSKKEKDRRFRKDYISKAAYKKEVAQLRKFAQKDLELEIIDLRRLSKYRD